MYYRAVDAGVFAEDDHIELIVGDCRAEGGTKEHAKFGRLGRVCD